MTDQQKITDYELDHEPDRKRQIWIIENNTQRAFPISNETWQRVTSRPGLGWNADARMKVPAAATLSKIPMTMRCAVG